MTWLTLLGLLLSSTMVPSLSGNQMPAMPSTVLWAWERPEDLGFINPREVGVAFLAMNLRLLEDRVRATPRLQALVVPPETRLIAVVRIEADRVRVPRLSENQLRAATEEIVRQADGRRGVIAVQIDFDATRSERPFYRELIRAVRQQLPSSFALSMTALVSWCIGDDWLSDLPIDEAVPMFFRMGADSRQALLHLSSGANFRSSACRSSLGISTDEPIASFPRAGRIYIFHPKPWSPVAVREVLLWIRAWQ